MANTNYVRFLRFIIILIKCLIVVSLTFENKLNQSDFINIYGKSNTIIDYDLPLNLETKQYLSIGEVKRHYYHLKNTKNPLTLTITPCSKQIEWTFSFIDLSGYKVREKQKSRKTKSHKRNIARKNRRLRALAIELASYNGKERITYSDEIRNYPGIYILDLKAIDEATSVTINLSEYYPYPLLPSDDDIKINIKNDNQLELQWLPSGSEAIVDVEYLIFINENENLNAFCQLEDMLYLNEKENTVDMSLPLTQNDADDTHSNKNNINDDKNKTFLIEQSLNNSRHITKALTLNRTYFVDIIAINKLTLYKSIYKGAKIFLPIIKKPTSIMKISKNLINELEIGDTGITSLTFDYEIDNSNEKQNLFLFTQVCQSNQVPITLNVQANELKLKREFQIFNYKKINLHFNYQMVNMKFNNGNDDDEDNDENNKQNKLFVPITFNIKSNVNEKRKMNIFISESFHFDQEKKKMKKEHFSDEKKIQVFNSLTTANSVTLAWFASTDDRVRFCIYKKELPKNFTEFNNFDTNKNTPEEQIYLLQALSKCNEKQNNLLNNFNTEYNKILCKRYRKYSKYRFRDVIIQKIRKLKASTTYSFLVQIFISKQHSLYFHPIIVTTLSK